MMDDLRYLFSLFFLFFLSFCGGGGGWSSSRWLFGTQLGWCHAVGLAVPQAGERSGGVGICFKSNPTTTAIARVGGALSLRNDDFT